MGVSLIEPDEIGIFSGFPGLSLFRANVGGKFRPRSDGSSAIGFVGRVGTETGFVGAVCGGDVSKCRFGGAFWSIGAIPEVIGGF